MEKNERCPICYTMLPVTEGDVTCPECKAELHPVVPFFKTTATGYEFQIMATKEYRRV